MSFLGEASFFYIPYLFIVISMYFYLYSFRHLDITREESIGNITEMEKEAYIMSTKISVNLDDNLIDWVERFKEDEYLSKTQTLSRTETIQQDLSSYAKLLKAGMYSVAQKITLQEFNFLIPAFLDDESGLFAPNIRPEYVILQINEYNKYNPVFTILCEVDNIDKKKLLETVNGFNPMECYGMLEYVRRYLDLKRHVNTDELFEKIGLNKELFKEEN